MKTQDILTAISDLSEMAFGPKERTWNTSPNTSDLAVALVGCRNCRECGRDGHFCKAVYAVVQRLKRIED